MPDYWKNAQFPSKRSRTTVSLGAARARIDGEPRDTNEGYFRRRQGHFFDTRAGTQATAQESS
jgi:hypothetical protein